MCLMIYGRRSPTTRAMSLCHFQFAKPLFVTPFGTLLMGLSHKTRLAWLGKIMFPSSVGISGKVFAVPSAVGGGVR